MDSLIGWIIFNVLIVVALFIDLVYLHRKPHKVSVKSALWASACWIGLAFLFNIGIYFFKGPEPALKFLAGYLIEESLSIDNLFVFILLFKHFRTPAKYHHKVLFWGVLGAIVMRAGMIFFGITLIRHFHWILYLFGAFLIFAGIKMGMQEKEGVSDAEENFVIRLLKKILPITENYENGHFFVKRDARWFATPLFVVLVLVETTDLVFALDSIPAVMAITLDPFIIYTSNIFAILGLRSLYFALSGIMPLFHFLHYALSAILIFVGIKMLIADWIHIPIGISLGFIIASLALAVILSLLFPKSGISDTK